MPRQIGEDGRHRATWKVNDARLKASENLIAEFPLLPTLLFPDQLPDRADSQGEVQATIERPRRKLLQMLHTSLAIA
jgi:hypothetical protein